MRRVIALAMPDPLSGAITVRASKAGYVAATQKTQGPPYFVVFRLEATGPSVDITGEYSLTLIADSTCTALPDIARRRTYTLAIAPDPRSPLPLLYEGRLGGATFYKWNDFRFDIGVSGSVARLLIGEYGSGFTEALGSATVHQFTLMRR